MNAKSLVSGSSLLPLFVFSIVAAGLGMFFVFALPAHAAGSSLAAAPYPCDNTSATPFLTGTAHITNDPDSSNFNGETWATDVFTENISVWVGSDGVSYCAKANTTDGTFVTTGPKSPNAGMTLSSGITGTFTGGETYVFASTSLPTLNSDYSTTSPATFILPDSSSAGFSWWVNQVFPSVASSTGSSYTNTYWLSYVTPNNGSWIDSDPVSSGNNTGDITDALQNVYVSASGSDTNNDGSEALPLLTIDAALAKVSSGGTVHVAAGTYDAFSVVNMSGVTIEGVGAGSTIIVPTTLVDTQVGHKGTADMHVSAFINHSTDVTIKGMTIQSTNTAPGSGGADAIVFWNNSSGSVKNAAVTGMYAINGNQTGQGIAVDAGSGQSTTLTVDNVAISGFQKNGIDIVDGDGLGASHPGTISVTVSGGGITGAGSTGLIAQNGVVAYNLGGGSVSATVDGEVISNLDYMGANTASGVLAFSGASIPMVSNTTFTNVQTYIANAPGGAATDATSGNTFDGVSESGATIAQLGTIEDKLDGKMEEDNTYKPIYLLSNTLIATPNNGGIQTAINDSTSGGTVAVAPGTYSLQLTINKNLTLVGAGVGNSIIEASTTLSGDKNIIDIGSGATVDMSGFTVSGPGPGSCGSINDGIYIGGGATATIHGNTVTNIADNPLSGCQNASGIAAGSNSDVGHLTADSNVISGYQKNGIVVKGSGSTGTITNNTITGGGAIPTIAQNGIELGFGATGTISGNTVSGNDCTYSNSNDNCTGNPVTDAHADGAAGVLLYAPGGAVTVSGNHLSNNQFGIWTVAAPSVTLSDNTISGSGNGPGISVWDADQWSSVLSVSQTSTGGTISGNDISGNSYGVLLRDYDSGGAAPDVIVSSKNNLSGNTTAILSDVNADATQNYWGHATGPGASDIRGNGNVSYSPWYTTSDMSTLKYTTTTNGDGNQTVTTGGSDTTLNGDSTQGGSVTVTADIPSGTVITGDSTWNGTIEAPTASTTNLSFTGYDTTVSSAVTIGSSDLDLIFSQPVKLMFANQAGKKVGWYNAAGTFTEITDTCDNASTAKVGGTDLATTSPGASCKHDDGGNLVVWTTHFSTFLTFTTAPAVPVITPSSESFTGSIGVTMDDSGAGAAIRYTTDGSDPICNGNGNSYTNGQTLTFSNTTTLKAIRCDGSTASSLSTATFTLAAVSSGGGGGGGGSGGPIGLVGTTNGSTGIGAAVIPTVPANTGSTGGEVLGASAYQFSVNLTTGSTGNDVTELQKVLIAEGDLSIGAPTGVFGPLTKAAVIKYQTAHKISPQSGYVGSMTRGVLNQGTQPTTPEVLGASAYNFATNLSVGSTGADVTALQNLLTTTGDYTGPVTGYFGPLTKAAVQKYQTSHNVSATGTVGPLTRGELNKGI